MPCSPDASRVPAASGTTSRATSGTGSVRLDDPGRLAAVARSGLLDSPVEESFDRATRLASRLLGVPVSLVSVVTDRRQFFKSATGLAEPWSSQRQTPLSHSFCQHVVADDDPLAVADARRHPLVADNAAVQAMDVIAYLGVPVHDEDGNALGALCAIDHSPRQWDEQDLEVLEDLAEFLRTELRLRAASRQLADTALDERLQRRQREWEDNLRFSELAEHTTDAIFVLEARPDLEVAYLSPAMEELTGHSRDQLLADPTIMAGLLGPDDHAKLEPLLQHQGADAVLLRCRRADATSRWVEVTTTVLADDEGRVRLVQGVARDVDHVIRTRQALQEALQREQQAAAEARQVSELKSTFLTAISHEVRTPLTAVVGFADMLASDMPLSDQQASELTGRLRDRAHDLQRLLLDVLDLDRLLSHDLHADARRTPLRQVVAEVVAAAATDRIQTVVADLDVHCDPDHLRRILEDLLDNALRHTPPNTPITIETHTDGDRVVLVIEDRGPGVPDEYKQRVFRPFTHGPEAAEAPSPGSGLGLTLARELATVNDGTVTLGDAPDGGTRVTVRLPHGDVHGRKQAKPRPSAAIRGSQ